MPERLDQNLLNTTPAGDNDSFGAKLQREAELLRDGLSGGVVNRLQHLYENPGETAAIVGGCVALGAGLQIAARIGGKVGTAARVAGYGFTALAGVDVARRAVPTFGAMADTWSSADNLDANKSTVAHYAGSALVDYPLMLAAGYGGFQAGRISGLAVRVEVGTIAIQKQIGQIQPADIPASSGKLFELNRIELPASTTISAFKPAFRPTILPYDLTLGQEPERLKASNINAAVEQLKPVHPARGGKGADAQPEQRQQLEHLLQPNGQLEFKKIELNPPARQIKPQEKLERRDPLKLEFDAVPPLKKEADDRTAFMIDALKTSRFFQNPGDFKHYN